MATVINININGYSVSQTNQTTPEPFRGYTLLPGFTATRELFGERKIKAKKKKNCTNGQVCGFSCISKTKVCIANMTTAQLKEHNAAKRAEKKAAKLAATGGGAASGETNSPVTPMSYTQRTEVIAENRIAMLDPDSLNVDGLQGKFSDKDIQSRASAIEEAGSFIRPVILEQAEQSLNPTYNVIDGELTAIAYQEAFKKNPKVMARTIIVTDKNREYVMEQLELNKAIKREPIQSNAKASTTQSGALEGLTTPMRYDISDLKTDYKPTADEKVLIESLARNYVKGDGPMTPLIIKSAGINKDTFAEEFVVASGRVEFLAAQRAKELDPTLSQLKAVQLTPQNEAAIARQTQESLKD